jgi:predicted RNA binding protein YcfA (HicA-like mRNA interferase family)
MKTFKAFVNEEVEQIDEIIAPIAGAIVRGGAALAGGAVRAGAAVARGAVRGGAAVAKGATNAAKSTAKAVGAGVASGIASGVAKKVENKVAGSNQQNKQNEEVELLDEMPGANMDTRAVHQHLKKKGWTLSRTSGSHDVYTHPSSSEHIAVPRHKQLKAPLVNSILKQSVVKEDAKPIEEVAAWQRKEGQSESGGLNRKGIESYRRENPGSKLSMAVTTKPSKLDPDSKAAKRRKSFCARMGGMKKRLTSAKTANDPDSRINKALRKWNC